MGLCVCVCVCTTDSGGCTVSALMLDAAFFLLLLLLLLLLAIFTSSVRANLELRLYGGTQRVGGWALTLHIFPHTIELFHSPTHGARTLFYTRLPAAARTVQNRKCTTTSRSLISTTAHRTVIYVFIRRIKNNAHLPSISAIEAKSTSKFFTTLRLRLCVFSSAVGARELPGSA